MPKLKITFTGLIAIVPIKKDENSAPKEVLLTFMRDDDHFIEAYSDQHGPQKLADKDFTLELPGSSVQRWNLKIPTDALKKSLVYMPSLGNGVFGKPDAGRILRRGSGRIVDARMRLTVGELCAGAPCLAFTYRHMDTGRKSGGPVTLADSVIYSVPVSGEPTLKNGETPVQLARSGDVWKVELRNRMTCEHWKDYRQQNKLRHICAVYRIAQNNTCRFIPETKDGRNFGQYPVSNHRRAFIESECPEGSVGVDRREGTRPVKCPLALFAPITDAELQSNS